MASSKQGSQGNRGGKDDDGKSKQQGQDDTSNRGFASMDPAQQRDIAAEGGRAAHASGHAHEFTSEEAREAGRMSHKNDGNQQSGKNTGASQGGKQGGTPEQHAEAGRQSHKNDKK